MRIIDCSSDVCSSDLGVRAGLSGGPDGPAPPFPARRGLRRAKAQCCAEGPGCAGSTSPASVHTTSRPCGSRLRWKYAGMSGRSEEHTSELQSLMRTSYAVFCLKQKKEKNTNKTDRYSITN